jgi:hypothetical protein
LKIHSCPSGILGGRFGSASAEERGEYRNETGSRTVIGQSGTGTRVRTRRRGSCGGSPGRRLCRGCF